MSRSAPLVIRPDSGNPVEVISKVLQILWDKFGQWGSTSLQGFRLLPPQVRIIQGDGINSLVINEILTMMITNDWDIRNIAFGSGGGLLQKFNRDTSAYAFKACYATVDGVSKPVSKNPVTSKGKRSKAGDLTTVWRDDQLVTLCDSKDRLPDDVDALETVYENGWFVREQSLSSIRKIISSNKLRRTEVFSVDGFLSSQ
jgi:nicotinamide phosphoribosyltransferase